MKVKVDGHEVDVADEGSLNAYLRGKPGLVTVDRAKRLIRAMNAESSNEIAEHIATAVAPWKMHVNALEASLSSKGIPLPSDPEPVKSHKKAPTRTSVKVYLATTFPCRQYAVMARDWFTQEARSLGIDIEWTSEWIDVGVIEDLKERAELDIAKNVEACDILLAIAPWGKGSVSEIAYAVGANKYVTLLCDDNYLLNNDDTLIAGLFQPLDVIESRDKAKSKVKLFGLPSRKRILTHTPKVALTAIVNQLLQIEDDGDI